MKILVLQHIPIEDPGYIKVLKYVLNWTQKEFNNLANLMQCYD